MASASYSVLGTPGFIRAPERFDDEHILKALGANSGNLMFQYATTQIVDAPLVHMGVSETPYTEIDAVRASRAMIFPAANHLRLGADWTGLNNYLGGLNKDLVILGLGAQSPSLGGAQETIAALKADTQVQRFADILRDKAVFVSVRGAYSQTVCHELGLKDVHVLGCPSALINPDPGLGLAMEQRLKLARGGGKDPRAAITAAAPFEIHNDPPKRAIEQRLFRWAYDSDGLYVQQSGGSASMQAANGEWYKLDRPARTSLAKIMAPDMDPVDVWAFMAKAGRFYISAQDWRHEMRSMDLSIGTRLHGNMASIAAGTPGVIIAHDSRTGELGQTMHLPRLSMDEAMAATDLRDAIGRIQFDGATFDRWRAATARTLTTAFERLDIPVSAHVRALAT